MKDEVDGQSPAGAGPPRFYTVSDAADILRVSPMTIYRAVASGEFPAVKVRSRIVIPAEAIATLARTALQTQAVVDSAEFVVKRRSP